MLMPLPVALNMLRCGIFSKAKFYVSSECYYRVNNDKLQFVTADGEVIRHNDDINVKAEIQNYAVNNTKLVMFN